MTQKTPASSLQKTDPPATPGSAVAVPPNTAGAPDPAGASGPFEASHPIDVDGAALVAALEPPPADRRLPKRDFYPLLGTLQLRVSQLQAVHESTSWRITRPIRALKDFFLGR